MSAGDFRGARAIIMEALKSRRRDADLHFRLAVCLDNIGEPDEAACELTEALRLAPSMGAAARRLSSLFSRHKLAHPRIVDPAGLKAAFACADAGRQPLVDAAFAYLASAPPLGPAVVRAAKGEPLEAARDLVLRRTSEALTSELLLLALEHGLNRSLVLEQLLAALRRVVVAEAAPDRFSDRDLYAFAVALVRQLLNNEYVWPVSSEERAALARLPIDRAAICAGDFDAGRRLLLNALYRSPVELLGAESSSEEFQGVRPKALRLLIQGCFAAWSRERQLAAGLPRIGAIDDATSARVARQYEARPYPPWITLQAAPAGSERRRLERVFSPQTMSFMDQPFDVLIAGAGTCQHAISSALAYGACARVVAVDLSAASLAYGKRMAEEMGVGNIEFVVADVLNAGDLARKFRIIECVGVLHHMAEPFEAWRRLAGCLEPHGLMCIGLYSAVARRPLGALRAEPGFPGPSCSDEEARSYRAELIRRAGDGAVAGLSQLSDFYSSSGFRDLVLHEHEVGMRLEEIASFLDENDLKFRGFDDEAAIGPSFAAAFPDDPLPGSLANWARYEEDHPATFEGMYQFWVEHDPRDART